MCARPGLRFRLVNGPLLHKSGRASMTPTIFAAVITVPVKLCCLQFLNVHAAKPGRKVECPQCHMGWDFDSALGWREISHIPQF